MCVQATRCTIGGLGKGKEAAMHAVKVMYNSTVVLSKCVVAFTGWRGRASAALMLQHGGRFAAYYWCTYPPPL